MGGNSLMGLISHGQAIPAAGEVILTVGGYGPVPLGVAFDATDASRALGFFEINVTDLRSLRGTLRYRRVGTGILVIELFNETTGVALLSLSDSTTTTNQSVTQTIFPPIGNGIHFLRVRIRSTVASDVPIFFGASFILSPS
jgi:hypothetical protein